MPCARSCPNSASESGLCPAWALPAGQGRSMLWARECLRRSLLTAPSCAPSLCPRPSSSPCAAQWKASSAWVKGPGWVGSPRPPPRPSLAPPPHPRPEVLGRARWSFPKAQSGWTARGRGTTWPGSDAARVSPSRPGFCPPRTVSPAAPLTPDSPPLTPGHQRPPPPASASLQTRPRPRPRPHIAPTPRSCSARPPRLTGGLQPLPAGKGGGVPSRRPRETPPAFRHFCGSC